MSMPTAPGWPHDVGQLVDNLIETLPCRDQRPYPEVHVAAPNQAYATLLLDAYANGAAAELTAIAQYMHHHFTIPEKDIADLELCTALVEMKHLEMLGELISDLGLDPRYWRANCGYWHGSNVAYGSGTRQKLLMDIEAEEAAVAGYNRLLREIGDPAVATVLSRILADECVHLQLFHQALARVEARG